MLFFYKKSYTMLITELLHGTLAMETYLFGKAQVSRKKNHLFKECHTGLHSNKSMI